MRKSLSFTIADVPTFKTQLLRWGAAFSPCCVLDSNYWKEGKNELIAAIGSVQEIMPSRNSFEALRALHLEKKDWLFGYLAYDLKNETEDLSSGNFDGLGFAQMHFFQPQYVFILTEGKLDIHYKDDVCSEKKIADIFREITTQPQPAAQTQRLGELKARIPKEEYLTTVENIIKHIRLGDIYEMNYCMEFFSENAAIDPAEIFLKLNESSLAPFSAFFRSADKYLMCASPERFLKKVGRKIISQPIKGTSKRGRDAREDEQSVKMLSQSEKEKSENVMIVDLVRNDLSKSCNNVQVDELFGIYTFKQWHQMISTISGTLREGVDLAEVIKSAFPMGSMTGAPKVRAMELIEKYERTKRGLYSGSVGYITPDADLDLNVVIRSILYNSSNQYLSFQAGSAITSHSVAENEYEECLLKANGMLQALRTQAESTGSSSHIQYDHSHA